MSPVPYRVRQPSRREPRFGDAATAHRWANRCPHPQPGEFMMMYAFGIGEIAISVSGVPDRLRRDHHSHHPRRSARSAGRCTTRKPGTVIGMRGPFGTSWGLAEAVGRDLVIVAGGVGSGAAAARRARRAGRPRPLRHGHADRGRPLPRRLPVRRGTPRLGSRDGSIDVHLTVDVPVQGWPGEVGFVTEPLRRHATAARSHDRLPVRAGADDAQRRQGAAAKGHGAQRYSGLAGTEHAVRDRLVRTLPAGSAAAVPRRPSRRLRRRRAAACGSRSCR